MAPTRLHDVRLRLLIDLLRPFAAVALALGLLAAFGLVGANDYADEQLVAQMKAGACK